ncbi:hypothetical protein [Actinosynnema sp. NPDC020468]|uniref:hypothetical protein n=1 Tax=Actinosynnema sp. NPDC020468 TaxID=3154488 RepID=UPI0033F59CA2
MYESMTVQVRSDLGERRLVAAVRSLLERHEVLRADGASAASCVRHVYLAPDSEWRAADEVAAASRRNGAFQVVWLDSGTEARLVLVARSEALEEVPWRVLLPELASAWNASPVRVPA